MNFNSLIATYYFINCKVSFYDEDVMTVSRAHGHVSPFADSRKFRVTEDVSSMFFDFYNTHGYVPSYKKLLDMSCGKGA